MTTQTQSPPVNEARALQLPPDPNAAMIEMMSIIDQFRAMMIKETEALDGADANAFLDLQDEKLDIARQYEQGMGQLLDRKEQLRAADPALRNRLHNMQRGFHDIVTRNLEGLERMKHGTARLHDRIMTAARDTALNESRFAYGAGGTMQGSGKASIGISEQA